MADVMFHVIVWPTFGVALLVFGFAPGAVLRLVVLAFNRDDPRRRELLGELYAVPRIERPFWVAEQIEVALFDGLRGRYDSWRNQRLMSRAEEFDGFAIVFSETGGFWVVRPRSNGGFQTDFTVSPLFARRLAEFLLSHPNLPPNARKMIRCGLARPDAELLAPRPPAGWAWKETVSPSEQ